MMELPCVDITKQEWVVITTSQAPGGLERFLIHSQWAREGLEVFAILSSPDRIVFRKKAEEEE